MQFHSFQRAGALLALCAAPLAAQADILGVTFAGAVYDVDSATGAATTLVASGPSFNSLASDGSTMWSVVTFGGQLATIDATTGVATLGPALSGIGDATSVRGMAFVGSTLYAVQNNGGATAIGPDALYRIDTATGNATLVGATGQTGMQALAANASGQLYGWDVGVGLMTIDAATGAATDVSAAGGGGSIQTLAFSPGGVLYAGSSALFTVDMSTGGLTLVANLGGAGGNDLRGMEFITAVPEPTPAALLAAGLGVMGWALRRRRQGAVQQAV